MAIMRRRRLLYGGGRGRSYATFVVVCWLFLLLEATTLARLGNVAATSSSTDVDCDCLWEQESKEEEEGPSDNGVDQKKSHQLIRIAYLITVHNSVTANDAVHLVRAIVAPWVRVLIHVDVKMDFEKDYKTSVLHEVVTTCPCGAHITVDSVHDAEWSTWSMNLPTLWAMELLNKSSDWDVFINLSGDTLPVLKPTKLRQAISALRGITFLTSSACTTGLLPTSVYVFPKWWHKRAHYMPENSSPEDYILTYTDGSTKKEHQVELEIYFGSQWMTLGRDVVEFIVQELKRPDSLASQLKSWLMEKEKLMTDETFFPTLLMHTPQWNATLPIVNEDDDWRLVLSPNSSSSTIPYPSDLPMPTDLRFERMDEHVPTAFGETWPNQRYDVTTARSEASRPKPWGPYFLGVYDLHVIRMSGALFVRKVSTEVDPNLVALLPVSRHSDLPDISWPKQGIQLTEFVDWKEWMEERRKKHADASDEGNTNDDEVIPPNTVVDDGNEMTVKDDDEEL